ncbi:MAG: hypothetical protein ACI9VR_005017, partial [Cognaticolwellia sp.]
MDWPALGLTQFFVLALAQVFAEAVFYGRLP